MDTRYPEPPTHDEPRHIHIPRPSRRSASASDANAIVKSTILWTSNPPAPDLDSEAA